MEVQALVTSAYSTALSVIGGASSGTSSVAFYDYNRNKLSSSPTLANTTNTLSVIGSVTFAGGSYGVSKLINDKWSSITPILFAGNVYTTIIMCNATSFIPVNSTGYEVGDSTYETSIDIINCNDPQFKDTTACQSNNGGISIWGIFGVVAVIIFTLVVLGVVGVLFYIHKLKKAEDEVEFI